MTTETAAPSLAELKEAALIRRAPRNVSVLTPCICNGAYAECPLCRGKGDHPVKLKPHPQCVDSALRCKCGRLMVVGLANVLVSKNGCLFYTEDNVNVPHWCCPFCPEAHREAEVRAKVVEAFLAGCIATPARIGQLEKKAAKLYRFLKSRGRAMNRLGLKESAIMLSEVK